MIYFVEAMGADLLKIGFTDQEPTARLSQLQTGCPYKLRLVATRPGDARMEAVHHKSWADLRVQGEWFRIDHRLRWYLNWLEFASHEKDAVADRIRELWEWMRYHRERLDELDHDFVVLDGKVNGMMAAGSLCSRGADCRM